MPWAEKTSHQELATETRSHTWSQCSCGTMCVSVTQRQYRMFRRSGNGNLFDLGVKCPSTS